MRTVSPSLKAPHSSIPLQHLVDSLSTIVFTLDREGRFTFINKTVNNVLGYAPAELTGTACIDLVIKEDREKTYIFFEQLIAGHQIIHFENVFHCKDGSPVPISWAARWDAQDGLLYCTIRDITERRQLMELHKKYQFELEKQNNEMSDILKRITDGFLVLDTNWRIVYANRQALLMINCTYEQVYLQNIWELFPNALGTVFEWQYKKALAEQMPVNFETFYPEPLNIWVEVNAYPSTTGLSVYFRDITDKKKNEETIQMLSLVVKETNNAVSLIELDGTTSWINNAYTKITGYTADEVIGFKNSDFLKGEESDDIALMQMDQLFREGAPFQVEMLSNTKSNAKVWLEISGEPIFDHQGSIERYFFIFRDISERKILEQKLERQRKQTTAAVLAAQENERAYLGQELHDNINQILTTVKLYSELIHDGIGNAKELSGKSIQLLQDSINEIRGISKRLSSPTQQNIRFKDKIQELIDSVTATNKIHFSLDIAKVDAFVVNKELQLAVYRILQEHLTNILKHAKAKSVQVVFDRIDCDLVLKVTDNGSGFDINKRRKGIGITNMITRAESLNGKLNINSAPGLGCVLIARFPITTH
ncbi:PAS domain S-box protein [Chitinophagaceae bacterium LB-8]|uniref:histidine kinase n=1 Tax=Paraflavisolibacter caeni TaxID=2982496 RepID=A0A9X2XZ94_9BACT|nr:PAS domain S-box protein [Paraflavisolibacter caeni]MCU7552319.1 PAS domain S-box protein [Paraflavisolibacter caeni]